jgi:hypothetical protein
MAVPQNGMDLLTAAPVLQTAVSLDQQVAMLKRLPKAQQQSMVAKIGCTHGNGHMQRLVASLQPTPTLYPTNKSTSSSTLQTKMQVNEPDDEYEQEAEQVAEAVMRPARRSISR